MGDYNINNYYLYSSHLVTPRGTAVLAGSHSKGDITPGQFFLTHPSGLKESELTQSPGKCQNICVRQPLFSLLTLDDENINNPQCSDRKSE